MEKNLKNSHVDTKRVDTKEFELPETLYVCDIDTKVFQGIVLQCLSKIDGIALTSGNFLDNILGRTGPEIGSGIHSEKDPHNQSVSIKIEINIRYGISIPEKVEEIQSKVIADITRLTNLPVAAMHVVVKGIIPPDEATKLMTSMDQRLNQKQKSEEDFTDRF